MTTATTPRRRATRSPDPSDHPVHAYAHDVVAGRIVAGPWVRAACQRHLDDLGPAGRKRGLVFDADLADHAIGFFPRFLRLVEGEHADRPFILEPWQQFIVGSLFGWLGPDGARRFRVAYIEAGKGNGKTPLLAGVGLYGLMFDGEDGAEIYTAAVTRDQANIMFADARNMAQASALAARLDITARNIADLSTASFMRPVSSEGRSLDGKRVHMALIDEIHEHPTGVVVQKMRAGTKGRRQALIVEITNSGYDRQSICWHHHEYSIRVARGIIANDAWFSYVCALDEDDQPLADEACWPKANPNLGASVTVKYLREQVAEAKGMPANEAIVRRLNFCQWTQQRTAYIPMDRWLAATDDVGDDELSGIAGWGGLDLGQSDDFSAFVAVFRLPDRRIATRRRYWIPEATRQLHPDRPYDVWERTGLLKITSGDTTDYDLVESEVWLLCQHYGLRSIAYDKRFAEQMAQRLAGQGIDMVDTGQGFQLNEALRGILDAVKTGALLHEGDPILAWMADNLVVKHGQKGEVRPDKPSAKDKIDGMVALAMAWDQMIRTPVVAERVSSWL